MTASHGLQPTRARTQLGPIPGEGWGGEEWAPFIDPREGLGRRVRDLRGFAAQASDTVLVHYSAYAPRYFPPATLPAGAALPALVAWSRALRELVRHAEHPWNLPVMVESLVLQAQQALSAPASARGPSVHSGR